MIQMVSCKAIQGGQLVKNDPKMKQILKKCDDLDGSFFFIMLVGMALPIGYKELLNFSPQVASLAVPVIFAIAEKISSSIYLNNSVKVQQIPGCSDHIITVAGYGCWVFSESMKFGVLLTGAAASDDTSWILSLGCALVFAIPGRTNWTRHLLYKLTKNAGYQVTVADLVLNSAKYTAGYMRFTLLFALFAMRAITGSSSAWYLNSNVVYLALGCLLEMLIEDAIVFGMESANLLPKLDTAQLRYLENLEPTDRLRRIWKVNPDGNVESTVTWHAVPFKLDLAQRIVHCYAVSSMVMFPFLPTVSLAYLLGLTDVVRYDATDGAFHWPNHPIVLQA
eukprot:CAMPEP_0197698454 /NCGR_PEP_ID=MMETSP1338-20131121/119363_1 /TAXON_ID=43686 ORGANISM="Pelagodinium beii, Strain RCC1491" /NCGR_SAMPLE_ID=MMETSP1338 /ASSEMBLY_ACC=CAM_ASM_000754 /LENGTH=335 /DNA_ID=CAMNT_0043281851 /DNA_START=210 /DNA_END=1217 /DNA_ORIENTATION=+